MSKLTLSVFPVFLCLLLSQALLSCQTKKHNILVGTYTTDGSEGIYLCSFDENTETLSLKGLAGKTENPSYLVISKNGNDIYAVNENINGSISTFRWENNQLLQTEVTSVKGDHPCYVEISPDQQFIAVANYTSGNLSVMERSGDGKIVNTTSAGHEGKGIDSTRQESPHVHCVKWVSNKSFLTADLGIDRIIPYRIGQGFMLTKVNEGIKLKNGCGPRHITLHPSKNIVYATCELSNEVSVITFDPATLELTSLQYISTLPEGFKGLNSNADLHITPDGKYLYVSNRGHNSLAAFKVTDTGELSPMGHFSTKGQKPRNFMILPEGRHLLVANQDSHNIVAFRISAADGSLEYIQSQITVPSPVCLKTF